MQQIDYDEKDTIMNKQSETQHTPTERDPRWQAVLSRDATADGQFYYSVRTTGIYCRPSCAARPARPENVSFHATSEDAEQAGFRPCKRCKPGAPLRGRQLRYAIGESSLGHFLVAQSEYGLSALLLGDGQDHLVQDLPSRFPGITITEDQAALQPLVAQIVALLRAPGGALDIPLDLRGTEFQRKVWQALRDIPAGATASYAEIAHRIHQPKAVRAVARACAANHLAVVIPCHRVVRSDGNLSGYRWGVDRKRALLESEAAA